MGATAHWGGPPSSPSWSSSLRRWHCWATPRVSSSTSPGGWQPSSIPGRVGSSLSSTASAGSPGRSACSASRPALERLVALQQRRLRPQHPLRSPAAQLPPAAGARGGDDGRLLPAPGPGVLGARLGPPKHLPTSLVRLPGIVTAGGPRIALYVAQFFAGTVLATLLLNRRLRRRPESPSAARPRPARSALRRRSPGGPDADLAHLPPVDLEQPECRPPACPPLAAHLLLLRRPDHRRRPLGQSGDGRRARPVTHSSEGEGLGGA